MAMPDELESTISNALCMVIDPELGQNIIDLGLVYEIHVSDQGAARIVMTTTTRGCPATDYLLSAAQAATESIPDVTSITVELTYQPPWEPEMMNPVLKQQFGAF